MKVKKNEILIHDIEMVLFYSTSMRQANLSNYNLHFRNSKHFCYFQLLFKGELRLKTYKILIVRAIYFSLT